MLYQEAVEQKQPLSALGAFCAAVSGTTKGYPRQVNSILGQITLLSEQAKVLGVSPSSRLLNNVQSTVKLSLPLTQINRFLK